MTAPRPVSGNVPAGGVMAAPVGANAGQPASADTAVIGLYELDYLQI